MKEDANLVCSVAYDDQFDVWSKIQAEILDRLPLENVQYRNPMTSAVTTIGKLPIRFTPSSKFTPSDSEHPFRWFLSAYCHIYFLQAETVDNYKALKPNIKQWVESHNTGNYGIKRSWVIVFVPSGKNTSEHYNKIFSKISQDYFVERPGDRTAQLNYSLSQTKSAQILDFLGRVKELIISSFQQRCALYDSDLRKLESNRGTPNLEFQKLFITKESLGLMYQMMQLPHEALIIYEDLEALISIYGSKEMPMGDYPWSISQTMTASSSSGSNAPNSETSTLNSSTSTLSGAVNNSNNKDMDGWSSCCRNGDEILIYSMNDARIRFVKSKISYPELHKYTYSRQMYFLLEVLNNPIKALQKTIDFLNQSKANIDKRIFDASTASSSKSPDSKRAAVRIDSNSIFKFNKDGVIGTLISDVSSNEEDTIQLKLLQADIYLIVAAVKVARACKANIDQHLIQTARQSGGGGSLPISTNVSEPGLDVKSTFPIMTSPYLESGEQASTAILLVRELLNMALSRLENLLPGIGLSKNLSDNISNFMGSLSFSKNKNDISWDESLNDISKYLTHSLARLGKSSRNDYLYQAMQPDEALSSISQRLRHLAYFLSTSQAKKKSLASIEDKKVQSIDKPLSESYSDVSEPTSYDNLTSPDSYVKNLKSSNSPIPQLNSPAASIHLSKVLQLESTIPILFMRSLAAIDDLSGRYRKSIFERLKSALLMMYYCNYSSSAVTLSSIFAALYSTGSNETPRSLSSLSVNITSLPLCGPGIPSLNTSHLQGSILSDVLYNTLVKNSNKFSKASSFTSYLRSNLSAIANFSKVPASCSNLKVHLVTSTQFAFKKNSKLPFNILHESAYSRLNYEDHSCMWTSACQSILFNIVYCSQNLKDSISYVILIIMLLKCKSKVDFETFHFTPSKDESSSVDGFVVNKISNTYKSPNNNDTIFEKLYYDFICLMKSKSEVAVNNLTSSGSIEPDESSAEISNIPVSPLPIQYLHFPLSDFFVADLCVPFENNNNHNVYFKQSSANYPFKVNNSNSPSSLQSKNVDSGLENNNNIAFVSIYSCTAGDINTVVLRLFSKLIVDLPYDKILLQMKAADNVLNIDRVSFSSDLFEEITLQGTKVNFYKENTSDVSNEELPINGRFEDSISSKSNTICPGGNIFEFTLPSNLIGDYVVTKLSIDMGSLEGSSPFIFVNNTNSSIPNENTFSNSSSSNLTNSSVSFQSKAIISFVHNFDSASSIIASVENPVPIIRISEIITNSSNIDALENEYKGAHNNFSCKVSTNSNNNSFVIKSETTVPQVDHVENKIASSNNSCDITSNDIRKTIKIDLITPPYMPVTRCNSIAILKISLNPLLFRKCVSIENSLSSSKDNFVVIREFYIDLIIREILNSTQSNKCDEFKSSDIKFINPINSQWNCNIYFKSPGLSEDLHKQIFSTRFSSSIDNEKVVVENLSEYLENVTISFNDISVPQSLMNSDIGIELLIEIPISATKSKFTDKDEFDQNINNLISASCRFHLNVGINYSNDQFIPIKSSTSTVIKQALSLLCQKKMYLTSIYKSESHNITNGLANRNNVSLRFQITNNSKIPIIIQGYSFVIPAELKEYVNLLSYPILLKNIGEINQNLNNVNSVQMWLQKAFSSQVDPLNGKYIEDNKSSQNFILCPGRSHFIEIVVAVLDSSKMSKIEVCDVVKSLKLTWFYRLTIGSFNEFYKKSPYLFEGQFAKVIDHIYSETSAYDKTDVLESLIGENSQIIVFNSFGNIGSSRLHLSFNALAKLKDNVDSRKSQSKFISLESLCDIKYILYMKPMIILMNDPDFRLNYRYSMEIIASVNFNSLVPVGSCKKRFIFHFEYTASTNSESSSDRQVKIVTIPQYTNINSIPEVFLNVGDTNIVIEFPFTMSMIPTAIGETLIPGLMLTYEVKPLAKNLEADFERKLEVQAGNLILKLDSYNSIVKEEFSSSLVVLPQKALKSDGDRNSLKITSFRAIKD